MGYFPFFMDLTGKKCIIIGDGKVARRKAESLQMFDGDVHIYAKGEWENSLLEEAFLVIAATDDRNVNREIAQFCRRRGILVNVADSKEESAFLFPSVIRRGDLTIGISTQGSSPLIAAEIRRSIENSLPEGIAGITESMNEIRDEIKTLPVDQELKKRIFQSIYEEAKKKHGKLEKEETAELIRRLLSE